MRCGKREGDGATPAGCWRMIEVLYRAGRSFPPQTALPVRPIAAALGWCDAAGDRNYNRPVSLPYPASHEVIARADSLYDIIVILSHNRLPRIQGLGSAVFFHLTAVPADVTAGCVAITRNDMLKVLQYCGPRTRLRVWP